MPIEHRKGNLFESDAPALAHGCNCIGVMGAGIALQFQQRYPVMYSHYRELCKNNQFKPGNCFPYKTNDGRWVYNLASQDKPGPRALCTWIRTALQTAIQHAEENGVTAIAMPRIGSGLGGLDWRVVEEQIDLVAQKTSVKLIVYSL